MVEKITRWELVNGYGGGCMEGDKNGDYIDRDDLIEVIKELQGMQSSDSAIDALDELLELLGE